MNLVVGATGLLGSAICRRLRARNRPVRAFVRPGSQAEPALAGSGAEVVHGDLKDAASVEAACRGVQAVLFTATSTVSHRRGDGLDSVDRRGALGVIDASRRSGVSHFVYASVSPNLPADNPLVRYKREVEAALVASGMKWTILQPSCFMEVWFGPHLGWDVRSGKAQVFGSGRAPVSWISLEDVAEFAVLALERGWSGRTLPLGGPEPVSPQAAVRTFEEVMGRPFRVRHVPAVVVRAMSRVVRPFDPIRSSLMALGAATTHGDAIDMSALLAEEPLSLTSVRDYAVRQRAALAT